MSRLVTRVWLQADYGIFCARRFLKETQRGRNLMALWRLQVLSSSVKAVLP